MTDAQVISAIAAVADGTPNTALEIRTLFTELFNRGYKTGDVMLVSCSNQYITDNFDGTGLGIAARVGWAICNGANGTRNYDDRLPLPYGVSNLVMGAPKGANTHTLLLAEMPSHSHGIKYAGTGTGTKYPEIPYIGDTILGDMQGTESAGSGNAFSIENKSIVTLFIMKL